MSDRPRGWGSQKLFSWIVRIVALAGPLVFGCAAAVLAARQLPRSSTTPTAVARALLVMAIATVAVAAADRLFRRLLPLSMLLRLSLVFPDQAPSRFKTAMRAGSSRRLKKLVATTRDRGLDADPDRAAEQVLLLIGALGAHDRRTRGHCERVRLYAHMIGEEMGLKADELQKLQWGALLHDLGKLHVPSEILNKNGKPNEDEWAVLKTHPTFGERMIQPLVPFLGEWADAAGGHHERWDGTGYPNGRSAATISRGAAIVAVADSFETMTALRSYKKPMPLAEARAEVTRCAGSQFSPDVVRAFLSLSLGRLRLAMGPLASLAQIPVLGNVATLPNTMGSASTTLGGVTSAAGTVVASAVVATGLSLTPMADASSSAAADAAVAAPRVDSASAAAEPAKATVVAFAGDQTPSNGAIESTTTRPTAGSPTTASIAVSPASSSSIAGVAPTSATIGTTTSSRPSTTVASTTSTTLAPSNNRPPVAVDDSATAKQGTTIHIDVLANDSDADGNLDPLSVSIASGPTGPAADPGSVTLKTRNGHNEIDYRASSTPGDFSFAYRVCDASGLCTVATVRVSVTP